MPEGIIFHSDVISALNGKSSKEFWSSLCELLKNQNLITRGAMCDIFIKMKDELNDYLLHKSKTTWGNFMNIIGTRKTRSKLYYNVLKDEVFNSNYSSLERLKEIKNELSSIKQMRFNSVIPFELSELLEKIEILGWKDSDEKLQFSDILEILKDMKVSGVISYFYGILANAVNRGYALIGDNNIVDINYKINLIYTLIKLTLYRDINTFFDLKCKFAECSNLIEISSKTGEDIYKSKKLSKDQLVKEIESANKIFDTIKERFQEKDNKYKLNCIIKNRKQVKNIDTLLEIVKIFQMSDDEIKKEISEEIKSYDNKKK